MEQEKVDKIATRALLVEEFLAAEIKLGHLDNQLFTKEAKTVKLHAHCHQKALSDQKVSFDPLNLPENFKVTIINSGCCGMAGSFGYDSEYYEYSKKWHI
jgi:Fe-S oxidoreductase